MEEGHLSYHLWTTWPATLSTGTLSCHSSITVSNRIASWRLLVLLDYPWPSVSLSIKVTGSLYGTKRMVKLVSVWGSCVLHQVAASDQPAKLGLGFSWYQGLKGRVLGHCAVLCRPMDCKPTGLICAWRQRGLHSWDQEGQARWPDGCIHLQTWGVGGGTKAATFHVYLMPRTLKI